MGKGFATYDKVKELAMKKMLTVSDKKVFLHPTMTSYIRGLLEGMIHRYDKRATFLGKIIWEKDSPSVAYTDGNRWVCNAGHPFVSKARSKTKTMNDRNYRILLVTGLCIHELGHKLYTNFAYEKKFIYSKLWHSGELFPAPCYSSDEWTELQVMLKEKKYVKTFITLYNNITNALEDGYIEYRLLNDFPHPSNKNALLAIRERQFSSLPSLKKNIQSEEGEDSMKLFSVINILLGYAKYGQLKCKKTEYSDERIQAVIKCIPYIDEVNDSSLPYVHYQAMHNVIAILSPYILAYIKEAEKKGMLDESMSTEISEKIDDAVKISEEDAKRKESSSTASVPLAATDEEIEETTSEDGGESKVEEKSGLPSSKSPETGSEEGDSGDDTKDSSDVSGDESSDLSSEEDTSESDKTPARIIPDNDAEPDFDYSDMCSVSMKPEYVLTDEGEDKEWDKIVEKSKEIISEEARKEAVEELEGEHLKSLVSEDKACDYGNLHIGRGCQIERQKNVPDSQKEAYKKLADEYLPLSKAANREYIKKIKELNEEDIIRGRYSGQFDISGAYRPDKRMFSKKRLPSPVSLSIFLLIDESGSMSGERIHMARITAIIIEEFCRQTGIRLCIMGHTEMFGGSRKVVLTSYSDFDSYDSNDKFRLMQIQSKENNRDGYALRYAMNHIKKESTDVKLIINISDGAPAADRYMGRPAVLELQSLVRECERNNISVISAAIGSDRDTIKKIYGKGFLNISDLNMLPKTLISLIKKYMPEA